MWQSPHPRPRLFFPLQRTRSTSETRTSAASTCCLSRGSSTRVPGTTSPPPPGTSARCVGHSPPGPQVPQPLATGRGSRMCPPDGTHPAPQTQPARGEEEVPLCAHRANTRKSHFQVGMCQLQSLEEQGERCCPAWGLTLLIGAAGELLLDNVLPRAMPAVPIRQRLCPELQHPEPSWGPWVLGGGPAAPQAPAGALCNAPMGCGGGGLVALRRSTSQFREALTHRMVGK